MTHLQRLTIRHADSQSDSGHDTAVFSLHNNEDRHANKLPYKCCSIGANDSALNPHGSHVLIVYVIALVVKNQIVNPLTPTVAIWVQL